MERESGAKAAERELYGCHTIEVLETREVIRKRPGMYIGDPRDGSGLHHLVWSLVDEVVQAHRAKQCFRLGVTLHPRGAVTIEDEGPGLPIAPAQGGRVSSLEQLFTSSLHVDLHPTIAKEERNHHYGWNPLPVVNALSDHLTVEVRRDGRLHRQEHRRGLPLGPLADLGPSERHGTRITLRPDDTIFTLTTFDAHRILRRLQEIAFLNPALRVDFVDERRPARRVTLHGSGIDAWATRLTEGQSTYPVEPLRCRGELEGVKVDIALQWVRVRTSTWRVVAFASQHRVEVGSHLQGLHEGLREATKRAIARRGPEGGLEAPWARALRSGLVVVADLRGPDLDITGPCGQRLEDERVRAAVRHVVAEQLGRELYRDPGLLEALCRKRRPTGA